MKYIDKKLLMEFLQNKFESYKSKMVDPSKYPINHIDFMAFLAREYQALILQIEERLPEVQPEVFDTVAFQKGVQEGRRLEREDALTIADIEKFRRDAEKDILDDLRQAINIADELIKQLKEK